MIRRFAETGRLIDHDYFMGIGNQPRENYYQLKTEGIFDQATDYDANERALKLLDGQDHYGLVR